MGCNPATCPNPSMNLDQLEIVSEAKPITFHPFPVPQSHMDVKVQKFRCCLFGGTSLLSWCWHCDCVRLSTTPVAWLLFVLQHEQVLSLTSAGVCIYLTVSLCRKWFVQLGGKEMLLLLQWGRHGCWRHLLGQHHEHLVLASRRAWAKPNALRWLCCYFFPQSRYRRAPGCVCTHGFGIKSLSRPWGKEVS